MEEIIAHLQKASGYVRSAIAKLSGTLSEIAENPAVAGSSEGTPPAEANSGGGGLWGSFTGALGTVRDTVRDGAVDIWNSVPGNEFVEDKAGDLLDRIPFGNVAEAAIRELAGQGTIALDADAIARVQADPAMQAYEANIVSNIQADPRYGNEAFTYEMSGGVEFGGQRAPGDMGDQFRDPLNPQYRDTWNVAGNELTWLLRHANVSAVATVDASGAINITYSLHDVLDLRPGEGRSEEYNRATEILGTVWHDILGAEESEITATWTSER